MKRIIAIIQARMGSSRLPGKMMLPLHGYPVIEWVVRRVHLSKLLQGVVVAIPDTRRDDILAQFVSDRLTTAIYRGPEADVLARFMGAARQERASHVIRICADNPLVCGSEIDRLIEFHSQGSYDYAYNHIPRGNTYPDGLGAEITSMKILEQLDQKAALPGQREHVFNYIWDNPHEFRIGTCDPLDADLAHPELKLDLDTEKDYTALLKLNINPDITAREVVAEALKQQKVLP